MGKGFFSKKEPAAAAPVDPIEAAKISAPAPAAPKPEPVPAPAPVVAAPAPVAAAPVAHKHSRKARVKATKKVSLRGHFTTLTAGTIVSEDSYGPGIFERLAEFKVELEPLD